MKPVLFLMSALLAPTAPMVFASTSAQTTERQQDAAEHLSRVKETLAQRQQRLSADEARAMAAKRATSANAQTTERQQDAAEHLARVNETPAQRRQRLTADEARSEANRVRTETPAQRRQRLASDAARAETRKHIHN